MANRQNIIVNSIDTHFLSINIMDTFHKAKIPTRDLTKRAVTQQ